jgi:DNA-binding NarL/FixJ family response regulator
MENSRAVEILQALHDGVDPFSGEVFPAGSAYQQADTVRALSLAVAALQSKKLKKPLPEKAGAAWSAEEDQQLIRAFDSGKTVQDIAQWHGRTTGSIRSRLVRLGKITP